MVDVNFIGCVYIELNGLVLPAPDTCNVTDSMIEIWYKDLAIQSIFESVEKVDSLLLSFVSADSRIHNLIYRQVEFLALTSFFVYPTKYKI